MKKLLSILICSLSLGACNLDKMQDDLQQLKKAKAQLAELHVYVKELKASLQYAEFWITVHQLTAVDQDGQSHVLFEQAGGKTINLISRDGLADLLALGQLPLGDYPSFSLTLGRDVYIVTPDQREIQTHFPTEEDTFQINIDAQLSISKEQIISYILNFDADQFVVNAEQALEPYQGDFQLALTELKDSELYQQITTELEGTVVDIKGSTFWIETTSGVRLKVVVPGFASIYNERRGDNSLNFTALEKGQWVRILGKLVHQGKHVSLEALSIALDLLNDYEQTPVKTTLNKVSGIVISVDSGTGTLVLDLEKSSFLPDSDNISVVDLQNAVFTRGTRDMISVGMEINIRGYWDGSQLEALFVQIDEAPDTHSLEQESNPELVTLRGNLTAMDNNVATVTVANDDSSVPATDVSVELENARITNGDSSCLRPGIGLQLHAVSSPNSARLQASSIALENACPAPATMAMPEESSPL